MHLSHRSSPRSGPRPPRGLHQTEWARRSGGYILVKFALLLIPLLLMSGLSVDVGSWYSRIADIQKAADAAALAGVVWLPDETLARQYALEAAERNGYATGGDITVTVERAGDRRLRVTITDARVGSFFYKNLGGRDIRLTRTGLAEYVLPVPMGSPKNYFGTGKLLTGTDRETLYQSVNATCTSKVQGDRHQSLHMGGGLLSSCSTTPTNQDYRTRGYELYIEAKPGRTSNIEVLLYDPRYNEATTGTCTSSWTGPSTSSTSNLTITGTKRYQTYVQAWNGSWSWTADQELNNGEAFTYRRDRLRYRSCPTDHFALDNYLNTGSSAGGEDEDYTFTLFGADTTPLNDDDNLPVHGCQKTYRPSTAYERTYLGSPRWNLLCTITPGMMSGRYILRVENEGTDYTGFAEGSNQWGLVAKYTGATGNGLCDGRSDTMCPRVYGRDAISVYANSQDATASFFLAEIEPEHTGKTLELELWDPGEGGDYIRFQRPTGTSTWADVSFTWTSYNDNGTQELTGSGTQVNLRSGNTDLFNGKLLRIQINLADYDPPADNRWWKIQYAFAGDRAVTDRTTWSARVIGDPVHLLEEEAP